MEKNVGNADRHDQNLTNEEVGELCRGNTEEYVIEKKNNMYKKGGSKRKPRMSMNEVDNKKKLKMVVDSHEAITRLNEFITSDEINGSDMKLVIQKTLHASDLKRNLNRLNMPFQQVETHNFLTYEEKQVLGICGRRKDGTKEIKVQIVGPNLQMHEKSLLLKIWRMSSTENYVLTTNWFNFVEENKNVLKEKTTIQVWSFRKDRELCFGVTMVKDIDRLPKGFLWCQRDLSRGKAKWDGGIPSDTLQIKDLPNADSKVKISDMVINASVHYIRNERNKRLFGNEKRSQNEVLLTIINNIRMISVSLKVKNYTKAAEVSKEWNIVMGRSKENESIIDKWK
nr:hypothetical protein [Tanacetum cinerariifolium]GEX13181.1 hypothetical protein [Tanacetum cinerariifolium]